MNNSSIYPGWQICETLCPNEKCFRVRIYSSGSYKDVLHEHIPKHRLSLDSSLNLLKNLLTKYSEWDDSMIINSYLNNRRGNPRKNLTIQWPVEYPEPGVFRRFCSCGNVTVWMDEVITPDEFRKDS